MKSAPLTALLFVFFSISLIGQSTTVNLVQDSIEIPKVFPLLSPVMIGKNEIDVTFYNSLSTQKLETMINQNGVITLSKSRNTLLNNFLQASYGLSHSNRLNAGLLLNAGHYRGDPDENSSLFRVFGGGENEGTSIHAFTAFGFFVRGLPIKSLPELSVQSGLFFPTSTNSSKNRILGQDRTYWNTQIGFYQTLWPRVIAFVNAGGGIQFENKNRQQTTYILAINGFTAYELKQGLWYVGGNLNFQSSYNETIASGVQKTGHQFLGGIALFYFPTEDISLNFQVERPIDIDLGSLVSEIIPGSYTGFGLGIRYLFAH